MKIYFKTFGCKVNQYETQLVRENFESINAVPVEKIEDCDIAFVNTCCVTAEAEAKARNIIRRIRTSNPTCCIITAGCYSKKGRAEIESITTGVTVLTDGLMPLEFRAQKHKIERFAGHTRAFVKLQDGCDNFCSYCVIPYVRPKLYSRPLPEVVDEINTLVKNGYKEVVLCGIRLGKYNGICALLERIQNMPADFRVRLSSMEMRDVSPELLGIISRSSKICAHLHIPLQSGSDPILKKMNRKYTLSEFEAFVKNARDIMPGAAVTSDIIVGFPGEDEASFKDTYNAVEKLAFSRIHVFTFSPRQGTAAYNMLPKAGPEFVKECSAKLIKLGKTLEQKYIETQIGKTQRVLTETSGTGYTDGYIKVKVAGVKPNELLLTSKWKI